ncbi:MULTISPECIES: hypothetical protein [unclassified Streptomyces]|uniref:hypothetical protein n=1 Tax=unclassified Streptomyces TaxID=2593676 RepID=UPI0004CBDEE1|nr:MULTISPECIES: hypothetical protein [unclassified Streptomyces]KOV97212.1 hypothetical protein ADL02_08035 [Streptomyces sp. NRRL WC-3723]
MEMEPAAGLKPWGDLSTSLVVSGREVDSGSLFIELQLADSEEFAALEGVGIYSGPGWATLTVDERCSKCADEQAAALIGFLKPRKSALDALKEAGRSVKVDVAGVAESGSGLYISPDVLAGLAELGVPVTFTTVRASGEDEEDPLAWLG